jgi:hypothetical protein
MYCDSHDFICIAIEYCDFIAMFNVRNILLSMYAAETRAMRSFDQLWK